MSKLRVACWTMRRTEVGYSGYQPAMIILGIVLVIIGALLNIGLLYALGEILLVSA